MNLKKEQKNNVKKKGVIGRYYQNGQPVIVSFENGLPHTRIRNKYAFLTVISWQYNGATNNGMPNEFENKKMVKFEQAIDSFFEPSENIHWAYNRTGNNLKEFIFYISSQSQFMESFNSILATHERYPIKIKFYEDPNWTELAKLIEDFKN
ncbi:DUF695 domain-containing protein [Flammeovirga sp. SJP92]|uniref:DUF695 domain-containing protein n=1 Tax=Flammeovirga sp. SJP92 TaxID=1775430 RepID=UPI0007869315|nr:DUF695 domain-containing protein [Flammeovirga sp. SJP92]KXX71062.1 hypothetical protein AVL50_10700 [Flammeovirga sp. SJP92]